MVVNGYFIDHKQLKRDFSPFNESWKYCPESAQFWKQNPKFKVSFWDHWQVLMVIFRILLPERFYSMDWHISPFIGICHFILAFTFIVISTRFKLYFKQNGKYGCFMELCTEKARSILQER